MQPDIASVCCYFNPCHYQARLRNYHVFRENIARSGTELLTVELASGDDEFELSDSADTIHLRSPDVMWQKERLLNIGLAELIRRGYSKLVWLDADVVFHEPAEWAGRVSNALDHFPLAQVFSSVAKRDQSGRLLCCLPAAVLHYQRTGIVASKPGTPGFAWAARAEVVRDVPLYDAAIIGGGDSLIYLASFFGNDGDDWWQRVAALPQIRCRGQLELTHYLAWVARWGAWIRGNVTCVEQGITTLYHGNAQNRQYISRFGILKGNGYDPAADIAAAPAQAWRWATQKPRLHNQVRQYFQGRREDEDVLAQEPLCKSRCGVIRDE
jgi:hypothetical protein